MALTVAKTVKSVFGNKRFVAGTITFDSSYPTGGEAFTAASVGLHSLDAVVLTERAVAKHPVYDAANGKIKLVTLVDGSELVNASDQSATVIDFHVIGT